MVQNSLVAGSARSIGLRPQNVVPVLIFTVVSLILVFQAQALLGDPDTQWHIASGTWLIANTAFPIVDPFSHSFSGAPWIAKEWGSQVLLAAAYRLGGWQSVLVLAAACGALAFAMVARIAARVLDPLYAVALVAICLTGSSFGLVARPHLITLPVFALFTIMLLQSLEGKTKGQPQWLLLPVMVVWANCHGLFTLGYMMAAIVGLQMVIEAPASRRFAIATQWFAFAVALIVAGCMTPYGWDPLLMTLAMVDGEPTEFIQEWLPLEANGAGLAAYGLLAVALIACARQPKANLARILLIGFFGYMMAKHMRFVLQFSVLAGILAAGPIAQLLQRGPATGFVAGRNERSLMVASCAAVVLFLAIFIPAAQPPGRVSPVAALMAARNAGIAGPVFNAYNFGGFLTLNNVPTFVDGRTDQLFIGGFRRRLEEALKQQDPAALADFMKPYQPSWALLLPGSNEAKHIAALGWTKIYGDEVAEVFVAK